METQSPNQPRPHKVAYSLSERGGKSFWNRIGVAFVNRDGSITVKLDAVPVSGQLQIRDFEARDEERGRSDAMRSETRGPQKNEGVLAELPF